MKLKRRDALKLGGVTVVGEAALAVTGKPRGTDGQAVTPTFSPLSPANFPQRYAARFRHKM